MALEALFVKETPKGGYVAARRLEKGAPAVELACRVRSNRCAAEIPFKKSMRWSDLDTVFGRPVRVARRALRRHAAAGSVRGVQGGSRIRN